MYSITIILATYNADSCLQNLINSIIPQKNKSVEFIIVDGKSTDGTLAIIKNNEQYINNWISEPDKGIYDAWNKGIKMAKGEWIMFIGADDFLLPNSINTYFEFIRSVNLVDYDIISSKRNMIDLNGKKIRTVGALWQWPSCLNGMPISHPGALHNKVLFNDIGLFNIDYKIAGDYELLLRKGSQLKAAFVNEITIEVCEGGVSDSYSAIKEYYMVLKNNECVSKYTSYKLYILMFFKYTIKKVFRKFLINVHS